MVFSSFLLDRVIWLVPDLLLYLLVCGTHFWHHLMFCISDVVASLQLTTLHVVNFQFELLLFKTIDRFLVSLFFSSCFLQAHLTSRGGCGPLKVWRSCLGGWQGVC